MSKLITSIDETEDCFTIEDYYDFMFYDTELSKEDFIIKYENSNEFYSWLEIQSYDYYQERFIEVTQEANIILEQKQFVKVQGMNTRWNGSREVDQIIEETNLDDIIEKHISVDRLAVNVYTDKVELFNYHHDGCNSYTFTPFSYDDLTKKELLSMIDKEDYEWYDDKLYKATKSNLVDYLSNNI